MLVRELPLRVKWIVENTTKIMQAKGLQFADGWACNSSLDDNSFLWPYTFCLGSVRAFCGSFAVMVFAFVDSCQHPTLISVNATARKLYFF